MLPSREAMAEFYGPKMASGFVFIDHGNPRYEVYARELFTRVLQIPWPISSVIPFHFARGLMAEAADLDINWAEFAYKVTHPHQSHSGVPRILPAYEDLLEPLPPLTKVYPIPGFKVQP